jgi:hypothetical protein
MSNYPVVVPFEWPRWARMWTRRESWAWWALALSGCAGFLSFLSSIGYGYLNTWHGAATLVLMPLFVAGLVRARGLRRDLY